MRLLCLYLLVAAGADAIAWPLASQQRLFLPAAGDIALGAPTPALRRGGPSRPPLVRAPPTGRAAARGGVPLALPVVASVYALGAFFYVCSNSKLERIFLTSNFF